MTLKIPALPCRRPNMPCRLSNRLSAKLGAAVRDHRGSASSSLQETPHMDGRALPPLLLLLHRPQWATRGLHHLHILPLTLLQWLHLLEFLAFLMVPLQPFKKTHPFLAPKSRQLQLVPQPVHLSCEASTKQLGCPARGLLSRHRRQPRTRHDITVLVFHRDFMPTPWLPWMPQ